MSSITEILDEANADITSIMKHKDNKYLRSFMEVAFLADHRMNFPDGDPPYKVNAASEHQLVGTFWQIAKKMDLFIRKDLKPLRQETLFIQALESLPANEAKIMLLAKDQNMPSVYKKINLESLKKVGYFA